MRIIKASHIFLPLVLVGLLIGLSGCGSASSTPGTPGQPKSNMPDRVQIMMDNYVSSQNQPVVTLTDIGMVQQLYTTIYSLPPMPDNSACTDELGPHYTLTFYQGQQKLVTVLAENDGCRQISLSGEPKARTAMHNQTFWDLLNNAIYEATPTAHVDSLALMSAASTDQPPQTGQITSASTAQRLYDAIVALPVVTKNNGYLNGTADYQFIFHTTDQIISATLDLKQNLVALVGQFHTRGGVYSVDDQFRQLLNKTLASVVLKPAQPDSLLVSFSGSTTSSQTTVEDRAVIQKLYALIFTYSAAQPPSYSCLYNDKVARKQQWYDLTFMQWDLTILHLNAYQGSCTFVARVLDSGQSQYLQADQQFWTQLYQIAPK